MQVHESRRLASAAFALACVCAVLLIPSAALANLNPGDTQYYPPVSAAFGAPFVPPYAIGPVPASYVQLNSFNFPYNYMPGNSNEAYLGSVTSNVYQNMAGQLAFSYVFNNNNVVGGPRTEISHVTIGGAGDPWNGVTIFQAGADSLGNSTPVPGAFGSWNNGDPFDFVRDNAGSGSGVGAFFNAFNSGTELVDTTNDKSATIWFTTDATRYQVGDIGMIDTGTTGAGNAFVPLVPEPSSIVLLALGAVGAAFLGRRIRSN
jgi:hypothetical protein